MSVPHSATDIKPHFEAVREKKLFQFFMTRERIILKAGKLLSGRLRFCQHVTASETDPGRVWALYDALVDSSVLHPLHNDIKIAPFGEMSDCWIHVRWVGWDRPGTKKTTVSPEKTSYETLPTEYARLQAMLEVLSSIQGKALAVKEEGKRIAYKLHSIPYSQRNDLSGMARELSEFERKFNLILQGTIQELLPFSVWKHRGLMPLPFRLITIRSYGLKSYSPIKLSPSEARRLAHYIKVWLNSTERRIFKA